MSAREQRVHTRLHTWVMWRACNSTGTSVQLHGGARVTRETPPNINKLVSTVFVVSHVHVYETTIRLAQQLCPDDELPPSAYHVTRRRWGQGQDEDAARTCSKEIDVGGHGVGWEARQVTFVTPSQEWKTLIPQYILRLAAKYPSFSY